MTKQEQTFQTLVFTYYHHHGRHTLPWRHTTDPYHILVSELMLQQTQVERVILKYHAFIEKWPTVHQLAQATLKDVLTLWQGLGYNRRAKFLHECALTVVRDYNGVFPKSYEALRSLPGIGAYTAGAIMAFAFNQGVPIIETNIRTVYLHHFFKGKTGVTDTEILERVTRTLPPGQARIWYAALMDYGTHLKRTSAPIHRTAAAYKKQSPFKGSVRQVRGKIVAILTTGAFTKAALVRQVSEPEERVKAALESLCRDGLVIQEGRRYRLA